MSTTLSTQDAEAIRSRHAGKQALLASMRADRIKAIADQHSHVGVEVARLISSAPTRELAYGELAMLANRLAEQGFDGAGRIFASLARGIERGTHEMWGPEAATALSTMVTLDTPQFIEPNDTSLSGVAYPVSAQPTVSWESPGATVIVSPEGILNPTPQSPEAPVEPPEGPDTPPPADRGTRPDGTPYVTAGFITDVPSEIEPPFDVELSQRDEAIEGELDLRTGFGPDEIEAGISLEPALSPEVEDTPQAKAAALRRAARQARAKERQG